MSATISLILTPTGHRCTQPGLAHAMQRVASVRASAGARPRFTSSKLRLRTAGLRSGMGTRAIFMRSLRGSVLVSDIMLLLEIQFLAGARGFGFLCGQLGAEVGELFVLVLFEVLERLALLEAIHGVALHQDLEVDL